MTTLVKDLGENADFLIKSDQWLETERRGCADEMNNLAEKLRAIMLAQNIKLLLQERNNVALQQVVRDFKGNIDDIIISITSLPDAIQQIKNPRDISDQINAVTQYAIWNSDGYDIETSAQLRNNP